MHVFHIRGEQFPCLFGILAALDEIGGVKDCPDIRKFPVDLGTARRSIAVDSLFVFMAEQDAASRCRIKECKKALHHRVPVSGCLPRRDIEAKQADMLCIKDIRKFQTALKQIKVWCEILRDGDFAVR